MVNISSPLQNFQSIEIEHASESFHEEHNSVSLFKFIISVNESRLSYLAIEHQLIIESFKNVHITFKDCNAAGL